MQASVLSAWGMLETDLTIHLARSLPGPVDPAALEAAFTGMEAEGRARLFWHEGPVAATRSADMRYGEQVFEIPVSLDGLVLTASNARAEAEARFHRRHEELFTYALPGQDVALANARLAVTGCLPSLPHRAVGEALPAEASGRRRAWLGGAWVDAPVWQLEALAADQAVDGPALLDSPTTTVLLRPGDRARLDARGWLQVALAGGGCAGMRGPVQ